MNVREALTATDDAVYRTAQVITVLYSHRARGPWLRLIAVPRRDALPELIAVQGDRVRRPGNTVGLASNMGHTQHLTTRCVADLGADPATLSGLLQTQKVAELLSTPLDEQIVQATQALVALLDERTAQAKQPGKPRFWFRARQAEPEEVAPSSPKITEQIEHLRTLLGEVPVVTLEDVALDWDDVSIDAAL
ncbi:hypothetical protein [Deinococcus soli (ex Cha et al. 2016)]|uniref:Uncharacterized protein n=2 Tax=Deinococcus soli (ex Cha et al. 2016) TaxID=1309411 RepID=A0ACC6KEB1_9DEIO|nr:hypothetical protein [Deinococcus soli (ex Cha et al. 2016)]MDR6217787.1 hypothetical protein [Deinococcus soli (ex Cha et al. 2016)]MDR6328037.1 hypothetical protein [Deinococcus soli (ex Cha et al. 2016)]MDR6750889.1 hypothetical protein [Deinococcus soli (ex Cha et al. 2016)]